MADIRRKRWSGSPGVGVVQGSSRFPGGRVADGGNWCPVVGVVQGASRCPGGRVADGASCCPGAGFAQVASCYPGGWAADGASCCPGVGVAQAANWYLGDGAAGGLGRDRSAGLWMCKHLPAAELACDEVGVVVPLIRLSVWT